MTMYLETQLGGELWIPCGVLTTLNKMGDQYPTCIVQFCAGASRNDLALFQLGPFQDWLFMVAPEPLDFAPCEHMICDCRAFNMDCIQDYRPNICSRLSDYWDMTYDPLTKRAVVMPEHLELRWYNRILQIVAPNRGPAHWQRLSPEPTTIELTTLDKLLAIVREMGGTAGDGEDGLRPVNDKVGKFEARAYLVHYGRVLTLCGGLWRHCGDRPARCGSWLISMALHENLLR